MNKEAKESVTAIVIIVLVFGIGFLGFATIDFFRSNITCNKRYEKYNYEMELTYADGSKRVLTDYAKDDGLRDWGEPKIESPIFHKGYYVTINREEYYGIVSLRCLRKIPSGYTYTRPVCIDRTRYDFYKRGCSFLDAWSKPAEWFFENYYKY